MQTTIPLIDLEKVYQVAIQSFKASGSQLTPDGLIQLSLHLFQDFSVEEINNQRTDDDMLLFQYGTYNWHDEVGEHFSFDITRQFIMDEEDGDMFQLSWTLIYDPEPFSEIKSNNSWSSEFANLDEWEAYIKDTEGYRKACLITPRTSKLYFGKI